MDNLSTFPSRITKCLLFACAFLVVACESQILCDETYYLERYKFGRVSCSYELNFHAVIWYFGTSETPIARTDAIRCSDCPPEFDIDTDGSLMIQQVDLKHEGAYKISVIHVSGITSTVVIQIIVIGQLAELTIQDCRRSTSDLCKRQQPPDGRQQLICLAKYETPPTSKLTWSALHVNGSKPIDSFGTDTFTASYEILSEDSCMSVLTYNPNKVSFQYLTCTSLASSNSEERNKSIVVEGNIDRRSEIKYIFSGDEQIFECPSGPFTFGQMKLPNGTTYVNVNSKIFARFRSCVNINDCHLPRNESSSSKYITYKDEGRYTCLSSNGFVSSGTEINVVRVILPEIPYTAIVGCEQNVNNCTMNVPLSGELTCLLSGTKPAAKLSFNISFTDKSDITLSDEMFSVTSSDYDTNDSFLTTKFQFSSCLAAAVITCVPTEDPFQQKIGVSKVLLMTDSPTCSKDLKLGIILSIVILAIIAIIFAAVIFICMAKGNISRNNNTHEHSPMLPSKPPTGQKKNIKANRIQDAFDTIFGRNHESLFELEDATFQERLIELYESHPVISELLSFLATRTVNQRITSQNYCRLAKIAIDKEQLSVDHTLKLMEEMYTRKQIDIEGFVELSKAFRSKQVEHLDTFVQVILFSVEKGVTEVTESIHILEMSKDKIMDGNILLYVGQLTTLFLLQKLEVEEYISSIVLAKRKGMISTECLKEQMKRWTGDSQIDLERVMTTFLSNQSLCERDVVDLLEEFTKAKCKKLTPMQYSQLFTIATSYREMMSLNLFKILDCMLQQEHINVDMYTNACKNIIIERKENFGKEYKEKIEVLEKAEDISDCFVHLIIFRVSNKLMVMKDSIEMFRFLTNVTEAISTSLLCEFNKQFVNSESTLCDYAEILQTALKQSWITKEFVMEQLQHCMEKSMNFPQQNDVKKRTLKKLNKDELITNDELETLKGSIKVNRKGTIKVNDSKRAEQSV